MTAQATRRTGGLRRPSVLQLEDLPTVGRATARWLRAVGITTVSQLRRVGAPAAYSLIVYRLGNVCNRNLLYALAGALQDRPYNSFTLVEKRALCRAAGVAQPVRRRAGSAA